MRPKSLPWLVVGWAVLSSGAAAPAASSAAAASSATPAATLPPFPSVPGANTKGNQIAVTVAGDFRIVSSNGLPSHPIGAFPNAHNPNTVAPQQHYFRIPLHPVVAATATPFGLGRFGVALNGVPFESAGAEYWNGNPASGWQYEVLGGKINLGLDTSNAHVQPSGSYHYHGLPGGLLTQLGAASTPQMILLGYAADGFPIYNQYGHADPKDAKSSLKKLQPGFALKKGRRPGNPDGLYDGTFTQDYEYKAGSGDLDECNGRFEITPEFPQGVYHYTLSETFPYIPRSFRGVPDYTFLPPAPARGALRGPPPPPYGPPPRGAFPPPPPGGA
jgi:hypothetical protein